ncbi:MAG TPA: GIY-YIG nuclease family protein [Rhizomicrobium sp.]|nr:GIY-YIG nuclease family protein [Rhizomicrobium sp.]
MGGWAYMLRCSDGSFYVGSTSHDDVNVRVMEHNEARYIGYTSSRRPVSLIWSKWFGDLLAAHAMERQVKGWSRAKKIALIDDESEVLVQLSKRRSGKPKSAPRISKRQLVDKFHSLGVRHPEVAAKRPTKDV